MRIRTSGFNPITPPFNSYSGCKGGSSSKFWLSLSSFPYLLLFGKIQTHKVLFSSEDALCLLTFSALFFALTIFFFLFILSPSKRKVHHFILEKENVVQFQKCAHNPFLLTVGFDKKNVPIPSLGGKRCNLWLIDSHGVN